ncbi:MAG: HAD-IC family P-type ATPase, partial [Bacteroidetes bacterium]|nr:HAD-IC family P-type ATPase [Bacteroidota bacterium]
MWYFIYDCWRSSIFIIIFITFYQYQKTEKALEALKKMASPRALVIRDGAEVRISGREVVPDDIILLHEGDRVCADAELLTAINLSIDESLLTGESAPVLKDAEEGEANANRKIYSGSLVVQGKGKAKVLFTGSNTEFGKIGTSLNAIVQDQTQLQQEMKKLIRNLFIIGAVISVGVIVAFYFTRGNFIQSLLNGLSASMAILPEEFPVVLTIFMALGAWRLSKKNVLTRNPSAIETLGSATVLCTDKTGTITQNKMEIACIYDLKDLIALEAFDSKKNEIKEIVLLAQLASQKASIDPMEKAIDDIFIKYKEVEIDSYKLVKEYPLSKELLAMTRVVENSTDSSKTIAAKGAPEAVFALCKLSADETSKQLEMVKQMAEKGYRVIAVAQCMQSVVTLPESQQ